MPCRTARLYDGKFPNLLIHNDHKDVNVGSYLIPQSGTVPHYALSYSKLFVWNMTQYESLIWLDSDTLVAESLTVLFEKADRFLL